MDHALCESAGWKRRVAMCSCGAARSSEEPNSRFSRKSGRSLIFGTRGKQAAFVIPGNPVSHFVCYHVAIRLAVERLRGVEPEWAFIDIELGGVDTLRGNPRETFWPATVVVREGRLIAL